MIDQNCAKECHVMCWLSRVRVYLLGEAFCAKEFFSIEHTSTSGVVVSAGSLSNILLSAIACDADE